MLHTCAECFHNYIVHNTHPHTCQPFLTNTRTCASQPPSPPPAEATLPSRWTCPRPAPASVRGTIRPMCRRRSRPCRSRPPLGSRSTPKRSTSARPAMRSACPRPPAAAPPAPLGRRPRRPFRRCRPPSRTILVRYLQARQLFTNFDSQVHRRRSVAGRHCRGVRAHAALVRPAPEHRRLRDDWAEATGAGRRRRWRRRCRRRGRCGAPAALVHVDDGAEVSVIGWVWRMPD